MGNPLVNELLIGTGFKDMFSMSQPKDDAQFASFVLDPLLARVVNAATGRRPGHPRRPAPRPAPPGAVRGADLRRAAARPGPVADLLRLNTGVPATPASSRSRLGVLAGDGAGFRTVGASPTT